MARDSIDDDVAFARALAAATCLTRPCTCRPQEGHVKTEDHPPADLIHETADDVTEPRRPTAAEREVLDLLDLDPERRPWVRLSLADWRRVDAVAARIARAVPAPRSSSENTVKEESK